MDLVVSLIHSPQFFSSHWMYPFMLSVVCMVCSANNTELLTVVRYTCICFGKQCVCPYIVVYSFFIG